MGEIKPKLQTSNDKIRKERPQTRSKLAQAFSKWAKAQPTVVGPSLAHVGRAQPKWAKALESTLAQLARNPRSTPSQGWVDGLIHG